MPASTRHAALHRTVMVRSEVAEEQSPGLNGPRSLRAKGTRRVTSRLLFLYLRQFQTGSQSQPQGLKDKCWIDPGTLDPGSRRLIGPEMDCI